MMRNIAGGGLMWFRDPDRKLMARVKDRIREEGPLFARDFEDTRASKEGWWDWKPAKQALEQLFMEGELTSVERQGFQKRYELMERFLPGDVDTSEPGDGEYADHVIDRSLRAHGFATRRTMTWLCRDARLRKAVAGRLPARVGAGELDERRMESGEPVYALPGAFDRHVPAPPDRVRLLSPFDNTVIQRARCAAVFGFDYTIECYVPEAKRRFGYYALPILFRDRLVGRMDGKGPPRRRALRDQGAVHRAGRTGDVLPRPGGVGVGLRRVHRLHGGGRGPGHPRKVSDPPRTSARRPGAVGGTDFRFHAAPRPTTLRTRRLAGQPARASKPANDRSGFAAVLQERLPDPIERLVIDSGCEIDTEDPGSRGSRDRPDLHPRISPCCIMQPKPAASVCAACGKTFADIRSWLVRRPLRLRHAVHGHEDRFRGTTSPNREPPPDIAPCVVARSNPRGRGAALPARTVAAHAAALPPSADVLGLRDRGAVRARRTAGRLAGGSTHRALPPVRHQRIRPGPGARECAAAAGLMNAACCIRALQLGAAPAAGGRVRWLRLARIGDAAAGKQR